MTSGGNNFPTVHVLKLQFPVISRTKVICSPGLSRTKVILQSSTFQDQSDLQSRTFQDQSDFAVQDFPGPKWFAVQDFPECVGTLNVANISSTLQNSNNTSYCKANIKVHLTISTPTNDFSHSGVKQSRPTDAEPLACDDKKNNRIQLSTL